MKKNKAIHMLSFLLLVSCILMFSSIISRAEEEEKNPDSINLLNGDNSVSIYADDYHYFVIRAGGAGIRITDTDNTVDILKINSDGTVDKDCFLYQNYFENGNHNLELTYEWIYVVTVSILLLIVCFMVYRIHRLSERLKDIEEKGV